MLIFPVFDIPAYLKQFLDFFLANSYIKKNPNEDELGNYDINTYLPRIEKSGFPFTLMSFFIGSMSPNITDEPDCNISKYLIEGWHLDREI